MAAAAIAAGEPEAAQAAIAQLGEVRRAPARVQRSPADGSHRPDGDRPRTGRRRGRSELGARGPAPLRRLSTRQRLAAPELSALLAAHEAAFWMASGDFARAVAVVESADLESSRSEADAVAVTECIGLLAWLEALRGNLTAAGRHAAEVLRIRPADGDEVGVAYAQLAVAWVHLERGELAEAGQRLDHTISVGTRTRDPWLVGAQRLAIARVATRQRRAGRRRTAADRPPTDPPGRHGAVARPIVARWPWPRHSWRLVTPPRLGGVDAGTAPGAGGGTRPGRTRPSRDRRSARGPRAPGFGRGTESPRPRCPRWSSSGASRPSSRRKRATASERCPCIIRALRAAHREELRSALSPVSPWLAACVNRHPDLSREHRAFLASMAGPGPSHICGGAA